jgi:four helix bundle protein
MLSKNYSDLIAWQKAIDLVETIYAVSAAFPREEIYGLTAQIRRSAISIPSNIDEGEGRRTPREFIRFLSIAHGSLRELETQAIIAERLCYLKPERLARVLFACAEVGRLITGLSNSISRRLEP